MLAYNYNVKHYSNDKRNYARWIKGLLNCKDVCNEKKQQICLCSNRSKMKRWYQMWKMFRRQQLYMSGMSYNALFYSFLLCNIINKIIVYTHRSSSTHIYPPQRNVRGNIAAVEPYNHTPQKSTSMMSSGNQQQQQHHQQIIQDLAMLKLKSQQQHSPSGNNNSNISNNNFLASESDESKIARQKQQMQSQTEMQHQQPSSHEINNQTSHPSLLTTTISSTNISSSNDAKNNTTDHSSTTNNQTMPFKLTSNSGLNVGSASLLSHKIISSVLAASANNNQQQAASSVKMKESENEDNSEKELKNKSIKEPLTDEKPAIKPKALHQIPSGNLVVPPRKPISSVAPTSITIAPKTITQPPKVHAVAPNNNIQAPITSVNEQDMLRPALPPKPSKNNSNNNNNQNGQQTTSNENENSPINDNNNLPIKAKPLTIKKQPFSEQPPKLRSLSSNHKTIQYNASRRIEMPPSFLFPEIATTELKDSSNDINGNNNNSINSTSIISKLVNGTSVCLPTSNINNNNNNNNLSNGSQDDETDETDKSATIHDEKPAHNITDSVIRRKRNLIGENVKAKLARRVSFDPLALLLDASLEGELELVRKTCSQVPNPSASNDEGITALHNAICAGHFEIVK